MDLHSVSSLSHRIQSSLCHLRRVIIFDSSSVSGNCVFSSTWGKWSGENSRGQICSLVQFFVQLSRQIDDGGISRVCFQEAQKSVEKSHQAKYQPRFGTLLRPMRKRIEGPRARTCEDDGAMQMVLSSGDQFACAIFHEITSSTLNESNEAQNDVQQLAHEILQTFLVEYREQLNSIQDLLAERQRCPESPFDENALMSPFESFHTRLTQLVERRRYVCIVHEVIDNNNNTSTMSPTATPTAASTVTAATTATVSKSNASTGIGSSMNDDINIDDVELDVL